jgi:glucosyl-3-phosphoglycerate synthase
MNTNGVRTFDASAWDLGAAVAGKRGRTVSVCIPCRNEAGTIGDLVAKICPLLAGPEPLVDELVVLDDRSQDGTGHVARQAGARVVHIDEVHAIYGRGNGKGNALWATLAASSGDFVVWCDGDVTSFDASWVTRLVMPLLMDDGMALVKGNYARPTDHGGGGRTTELVARPLISLFFPELAGLHQPLSGEYAVRRDMVEQLAFVEGWGAEIAMLIDVAQRFGIGAIGQVDLGTRLHRHQDLHSLSLQAAEVMATVLARTPAAASFAVDHLELLRPNGMHEVLNLDERPPLAVARLAPGPDTAG